MPTTSFRSGRSTSSAGTRNGNSSRSSHTRCPTPNCWFPKTRSSKPHRGRFEEKPYAAKSGDYSPEGKHPIHYCSQPEPRTSFAAMVTRLDRYVGEVTELIDSLGLRERTIIVFTSDNGPHREGGADPDFFGSYGPGCAASSATCTKEESACR
ncbi:MAG: sulfatase-like hydrolase/transferase [Alistipes finegoldii]